MQLADRSAPWLALLLLALSLALWLALLLAFLHYLLLGRRARCIGCAPSWPTVSRVMR